MVRFLFSVLVLCLAGGAVRAAPPWLDPNPPPMVEYKVFLEQLWRDAQKQGITRATFDLAFKGITPDPRIMPITRRQPEYGKPAGEYVNSIASPARIKAGLRKAEEWRTTLDAVEKKYRVERWILLAIWGMETSYGAVKDKWDVIRSLATLAHNNYRHPYFRNELLVALRILQEGHITRDRFLGSWAGAMGQTQFMPSNFFDFAVDFSGDGRRDIWTNVPDVLASTANYLQKEHWQYGLPWGFEVTVPQGFDYRRSRASFAEWTKLGLRRADGAAFPASGDGILFFPTGVPGPAFIVTKNFDVIKEYNHSDVYALAVGHLADRMRGMGPIRAAWPPHATQLSRDDRIALQKRLAELGHKVNNFSAHIDFDLRDSIRAEQVKFGMLPDGHPTPELLERLGIKRR
ncbi:MAG TPA: lytic murein transglycosylase [Xanthobacteraceae bacterium]|nr:lytic murein transglycosylase [Xanthobacteraceae bacterium]